MHLLLDTLYFLPAEDGVSYAIEDSTIKNSDMKWGWGFRFGLAEDFSHDDWQVSLLWTCIPTQHDTETSGHLTPIWSNAPQTSTSFVELAKVHWRLHLGIVDLDLEKKWMVSPYLQLQPHVGVRFASLREKFFVRYKGGSLFPGEEDNMHAKNKFWGVGPEIGINAQWNIWRKWYLVGKSSGALTWGAFYIHQAEQEAKSHPTHFRYHNVFSQAAFLLDFALGFAWQGDSLGCHLLWEEHFFPGQNHLTPFSGNVFVGSLGSLSMMGVSAGLDWKF